MKRRDLLKALVVAPLAALVPKENVATLVANPDYECAERYIHFVWNPQAFKACVTPPDPNRPVLIFHRRSTT